MKNFSIRSLTCKVNHYERRSIRQALEHPGTAWTGIGQPPDWVVVKTGSVRSVTRSSPSIRTNRRRNPHAQSLVCGCYPSILIHELSCLRETVLTAHDQLDLPNRRSLIAGQGIGPTHHDDTPSYPVDSIRPNPGLQIKIKDRNGHPIRPSLNRVDGRVGVFQKPQESGHPRSPCSSLQSDRPRPPRNGLGPNGGQGSSDRSNRFPNLDLGSHNRFILKR